MNFLLEQVLVSRVKSFLWRAAGFGAVAMLGWAGSNVGLLELPVVHAGAVDVDLAHWATVVIGLLVGEATKYFNSNVPWMKSQQQ